MIVGILIHARLIVLIKPNIYSHISAFPKLMSLSNKPSSEALKILEKLVKASSMKEHFNIKKKLKIDSI